MTRMNDLIREQGDESPAPGKAGPSESVSFRTLGPQHREGSEEQQQTASGWYRLAEEELSRLGGLVRQDKSFGIEEITRIAESFVDSLLKGDQLLAKAVSGQKGSSIISNMVHVGILAARIAIGLKTPREELIRVSLAGLLHDIGMFRLPEALVTKSAKLSPQEFALIKQHPEFGAEIISRLGNRYDWLAQVVLQEHERWGGQGYPKGLKESQIHEYARIIGIVDIFDALLSVRPYHRRLLPHEAVRELLIVEKASFPSYIIKALIHEFSVFPVGTTVRLNTGEVGVVCERNPDYPLRPVVEVRQATGSNAAREVRLLDLSRTMLVHIAEVVGSEEVGEQP
jgi:HD-GYP domain-containing protein (c-di-GMP phosphodiesterase class II)